MTPKIGIILINYKTYAKRFLEDCRDSMRKLDYPREKFVVYIVDNATTPETESYLKEVYPEAVILPNKENSGWGGGNNLGIERAWKDGCQDVVLSNMDVIVEKEWLKELVEAAYSGGEHGDSSLRDENKPIGIVQSKLLLHPVGPDGVVRINSIGNQLHFLGFGFAGGNGQPETNFKFQISNFKLPDIPYASGASMYVKREVFDKVGLFNPDFFMYHDDIELCLKAKLAGYQVVLAPKSVMWHKYEFGRSILQVYYMERNRLITMLQFYKLPTLLLVAPAFIVMELGLLGASIAGKYAKPKVRGWGYFLKPSSWKKLLVERRKIQALRTMSDRELMHDWKGMVLHQEIMNPVLKYIANPMMAAYWGVAKRLMFW
ncbi:glycosyltransferase family 2 protein [Candidatus Uhrbacteria bacterium]|nr:glycosyltransferase family 2 protein [Candidatus Uhrbacteria bacterium]